MKQIIIATKNKGKASEYKDFFAAYGMNAISILELPEEIPDIDETGSTFEENASLKAEQISALLNRPVLADDSGLIIDALDGKPGIYSARYAGELSNDKANMDKVLIELTDTPKERRTARFVCVIAVAIPGKKLILSTGYCEGMIGFNEKGKNGFGYDPIFIPKGYTNTMAELSSEKKNKISHRKNALAQLETWIKDI